MRNRPILILAAVVAVCAWIGLLVMMNSLMPEPVTEMLFVCVLFVALSATVAPVAHALDAKWATPLGRRGDTLRALRQGGLGGALGAGLVAFRFMGVLTPVTGVVLALAALTVEVLVQVRRHGRVG